MPGPDTFGVLVKLAANDPRYATSVDLGDRLDVDYHGANVAAEVVTIIAVQMIGAYGEGSAEVLLTMREVQP